ncbi:MAG TPA: hypothetical protein GXZ65_07075 [Clostridiales bacterium]|jgi:di/tricarboxylate transporter|nr:hypothetical protein [Clostridiales bacterium]
MNVLIFIVAIILAIVIGIKLKTNIGAVALAMAFLCGSVFFKVNPNDVVGVFPLSLFFYMLLGAFFYGFGMDNGTFKVIAMKILYATRKITWAVPLIFLVTTWVVMALGAGTTAAPLFLSPIFFGIVIELGVDPVLAALGYFCGGTGSSLLPWTQDFAQKTGILVDTLGNDAANKVGLVNFTYNLIFLTIFYVVVFIIKKGFKGKQLSEAEKPEPLNKQQKTTLVIIVTLAIILVVPIIVNLFYKNPVTNWMTRYLDFRVLASIGIVVCHICKLGDIQEVIKTRIPWTAIIMVCGTGTLVGLAAKIGIADTIGAWLGGNIPKALVTPLFLLVSGALSLVVSGGVVQPLLTGIIPGIAAASGVHPLALASAMLVGLQYAGFSPFSMGGTLASIGCTDAKMKEKIVGPMILYAILMVVISAVLAFLGVFGIFYH